MSKQSKSNVHNVNRMHKIHTGFNMYHKYLKHTSRKKNGLVSVTETSKYIIYLSTRKMEISIIS